MKGNNNRQSIESANRNNDVEYPTMKCSVYSWIVALLAGIAPAFAQSAQLPKMSPPDRAVDTTAATNEKPAADSAPYGMWPSERLTRSLLVRWVAQATERYNLDEDQRKELRERVLERWAPFLEVNRRRLAPMFNEFLEMRLGENPPDADQVRSWAERVEPMFQDVREQFDEGAAEFREMLAPMQRAKFEIDLLGYRAGAALAEERLSRWKKGEYEERELWRPPPTGDEPRSAESPSSTDSANKGEGLAAGGKPEGDEATSKAAIPATSSSEAVAGTSDQIAQEMDAWQEYVSKFILDFGLDDGQRSTVLSVLDEMRKRALRHRDRHREEIEKLEQRIAEFSGEPKELEELRTQLKRLYGPVDEMFAELKNRIEHTLTASQRAKLQTDSPQ